jgi:plastocyanin domain-containing protein
MNTSTTARRIDITVTEDGFTPDRIRVGHSEPLTLAFTRQTNRTCAKDVVLELGNDQKLERDLPLGRTVLIDVSFEKAGELRYGCSMDMITGAISVE